MVPMTTPTAASSGLNPMVEAANDLFRARSREGSEAAFSSEQDPAAASSGGALFEHTAHLRQRLRNLEQEMHSNTELHDTVNFDEMLTRMDDILAQIRAYELHTVEQPQANLEEQYEETGMMARREEGDLVSLMEKDDEGHRPGVERAPRRTRTAARRTRRRATTSSTWRRRTLCKCLSRSRARRTSCRWRRT